MVKGYYMALDTFVSFLPAEHQEAYKAEVAKAIFLNSKEEARALLASNALLNAEFQSNLSTKHEESMGRFQKEKLPTLIEDEIKKRGTKQPWEIQIDELKAQNTEFQRQALLKDRKAQAMAELSKHGLDAELSDFFMIEDEDAFKAKITAFTGKVTSWRDAEVKKVKEGVYSQPEPKSRGPVDVNALEQQLKAAKLAGDYPRAMAIQERMAAQ